MKRTTLSSLVMASLMVSTLAVPTFAGHRGGGSGGHNFGGGNGGGNSMGGNFAARTTSSFRPQTQVVQKFNGNVNTGKINASNLNAGNLSTGNFNAGNVNRIGNLNVTQKIQHSGSFTRGKTLGISQTIPNGTQNNAVTSSNKNWWCSSSSKFCGSWYPGKHCGYFGCYPFFGCSPRYGCYSNYWYPSCWYYPSCGYNYSDYSCSYGPQYCSPLYTMPVVYGSSGVSAAASSPVVVNVDARDADPLASPAKMVTADKLPEMRLGGTYAFPGSGFGSKAGQMFVEIGDVALGVKIDDWDDQKVSFTLPMFGLAKAAEARLHLVSNEGQPLKSAAVRLVMPTQAQLTAQN